MRTPHLIFQFHYGTIKSILGGADVVISFIFQFHYGTIKRYTNLHKEEQNDISIPLWYD